MEDELLEIRKNLMSHYRERIDKIEEIATLSDYKFAIIATAVLDPKKHFYGWETYIVLLDRLCSLLQNGMQPYDALDAVQTCWTEEKILEVWKSEKADFAGIAG